MFDAPNPRHQNMPVPTPKPSASSIFAGLRELVHPSAADRPNDGPSGPRSGQFNMASSLQFNTSKEFYPGTPMAYNLFSSPKTFSKIKRSLSSVFAAKSHLYSSTFFGSKVFYNDEFDFKKEPIHPGSRRQIRFGLKSVVDFVIQMDIENLKTVLHQDDPNVKNFFEHPIQTQDPRFSPDSLFGLLNRTNPNSCKLIFEIIERIVSNLHFSQSLAQYLASDGSIESTKLVISEAIKRGPDLGSFLRGGPFASCAQMYRSITSNFDYDAAYFMTQRFKNEKRQISSPVAKRRRNYQSSRGTAQNKIPLGFCFQFQTVGCRSKNCIYKHKCSNCLSPNHGSRECNRSRFITRKKNRDSSRDDRKSPPRDK